MFRQWWSHLLGVVAVAAVIAALALALAAPSGSATKTGGCGAGNWTAVDFVYSGNYRATGCTSSLGSPIPSWVQR